MLSILFLGLLECCLSFDNALALAAIARHLPKEKQGKALSYGVWGAVVLRFLALLFLTAIIKSPWVKLLGGIYLLFLSGKYFYEKKKGKEEKEKALPVVTSLWKSILLIEITDFAFSIDSIVASVGVSQTLTTLIFGAIIGILSMRFMSGFFIKIMDILPILEDMTFLLVLGLGVRLVFLSFS